MHTSGNQENIDPAQMQPANATMNNLMQMEMMKTLQAIQKEIAELKQKINNSKSGDDATLRTSNRKRKKKLCTIISKYCWTHGA